MLRWLAKEKRTNIWLIESVVKTHSCVFYSVWPFMGVCAGAADMSNKQEGVEGRCSCGQAAAAATATAAVEVMAENVTLRISRLCWRLGQQPDGVVWSQSGLSESGEGAGTHVILCGLEWGTFLSAKGKTGPVYHVAAMSIFRFNMTPSLDTVFFLQWWQKTSVVQMKACILSPLFAALSHFFQASN